MMGRWDYLIVLGTWVASVIALGMWSTHLHRKGIQQADSAFLMLISVVSFFLLLLIAYKLFMN